MGKERLVPTEVPSPVVDVHSHAMPVAALQWLEHANHADLAGIGEGFVMLDSVVSGVPSEAPIPCPPEQYDVDARIRAMDAAGIDVQVVAAPPYLFASGASDEVARSVLRVTNDAVAELVARRPDRLAALGVVPMGRPFAPDEAARCLDELGMIGLTCGTSGAGHELDDACVVPVWAMIEERDCFVLVHPSGVSSPERLGDFHLVQLVGYPTDTALAVSRLAFGGVLDKRRLRLCLAHGGGCITSLLGRLDVGWKRKAVCQTTESAPADLLRELLYDTVVHSSRQVRALVEEVGAERVLLGTDFPFDLADRAPVETLVGTGLAPGVVAAVAGGNAHRELSLP